MQYFNSSLNSIFSRELNFFQIPLNGNDITLFINAAGYEVTGGSLSLNGVYGFAGSDENE